MTPPRIHPVDGMSEAEQAKLAALQAVKAKQAEKVRAAFAEGQRIAHERAESLMRAQADAMSAEHAKDHERTARLWRGNADWKAKASLWLGSLIGVLFGVCVGWLSRDFGLDQAFTAASDATAKGAMIGTIERAARGEP